MRVLIYGASALKSGGSYAGPPPRAKLWGIKAVSAGFLAEASILTKFMISPDREFAPIGARTQIDYAAEFAKFKEIIIMKANSPDMTSTLKYLNGLVFGKQTVGSGGSLDNDDDDESPDEFGNLMDELDEAEANGGNSDIEIVHDGARGSGSYGTALPDPLEDDGDVEIEERSMVLNATAELDESESEEDEAAQAVPRIVVPPSLRSSPNPSLGPAAFQQPPFQAGLSLHAEEATYSEDQAASIPFSPAGAPTPPSVHPAEARALAPAASVTHTEQQAAPQDIARLTVTAVSSAHPVEAHPGPSALTAEAALAVEGVRARPKPVPVTKRGAKKSASGLATHAIPADQAGEEVVAANSFIPAKKGKKKPQVNSVDEPPVEGTRRSARTRGA
ncbi:hypothetical protein BV25DRAFT_1922070 [Artomyces pyxidatus]|uniref:Uncharacterized protein n=1 Tax=Artomyces pyxidatus TaxID=48021 RepID=A0ACB8SFT9_9AGAM|nr:hypothetical protein BV25DRAFT_1922070 [Artomyces pyxidatus]